MVKVRHGSSHLDVAKVRLTTSSILLALFGGVILIHVVLFWKATGDTGIDGSVEVNGRFSPRNSKHATVIPFVVSMTSCGDEPFMEVRSLKITYS